VLGGPGPLCTVSRTARSSLNSRVAEVAIAAPSPEVAKGPLKALIDGTTAEIGDATTSAAEGETIAKTIGVAAADRGLAQGREGGRGLATGLQGHPGTGGRGQGPETVASEEGA